MQYLRINAQDGLDLDAAHYEGLCGVAPLLSEVGTGLQRRPPLALINVLLSKIPQS